MVLNRVDLEEGSSQPYPGSSNSGPTRYRAPFAFACQIDALTRARFPSKSSAHWLSAHVAKHVTRMMRQAAPPLMPDAGNCEMLFYHRHETALQDCGAFFCFVLQRHVAEWFRLGLQSKENATPITFSFGDSTSSPVSASYFTPRTRVLPT